MLSMLSAGFNRFTMALPPPKKKKNVINLDLEEFDQLIVQFSQYSKCYDMICHKLS